MTREEKLREARAALEAERKRATEEANRVNYENFLAKAPADARGEKIISPLVTDATNAAHLDAAKLRTAKHYKTMPELEAMMQKMTDAISTGTAEAKEQLAELDKQIEAERQNEAKAAREADFKSLKATRKTISALEEERAMLQLVHDGFCKSSWAKYGPENVVAMYESLVEITDPEYKSLGDQIRDKKQELAELRTKRANLIGSRYHKWRDFYTKTLRNPELYFLTKNGSYINFGGGVYEQSPYTDSLYKVIQAYKGEGKSNADL